MARRVVIKQGRRKKKKRKKQQEQPKRVDKCLVAWAGDLAAARCVNDFISRTGCKAIVETGTYKGATTAWFTTFGLPVHTIEKNHEFISVARARLAGIPNATVHEGSSADVLGSIIGELPRPVLFFLDAHWEDYWPLQDELRIIAEGGHSDACLIVHDCLVPGRSDLKGDISKGVTLNIEMIRDAIAAIYNGSFHVSYNEASPAHVPGILFVEPSP